MNKRWLAATLALVPCVALGAEVHGVWKTEASDDGGFLEVTIGPCAANAAQTCGIISRAFTLAGEDPSYANLGKPIIQGMKPHGQLAYSGGTIWDPPHDKTYKSKMALVDGGLDVEGCISFFCKGEHWTRVE